MLVFHLILHYFLNDKVLVKVQQSCFSTITLALDFEFRNSSKCRLKIVQANACVVFDITRKEIFVPGQIFQLEEANAGDR